MDNSKDIFEQYYPYLGAVETSKEELMKHFECFLNFPRTRRHLYCEVERKRNS